MALRNANAAGGVGGHAVELVALNDSNDLERARQCARQLVADPDVLAVVGHFSNQTTLAALPLYAEASVPLLAPLSLATPAETWGAQFCSLAPSLGDLAADAQHWLDRAVDDSVSVRLLGGEDGLSPWADLLRFNRPTFTPAEEDGLPVSLTVLGATTVPDLVDFMSGLGHTQLWLDPALCHMTSATLLAEWDQPAYCQAVTSQGEAGATFTANYQAYCGMTPSAAAALAYDATLVALDAMGRALSADAPATDWRREVGIEIGGVERVGVTGTISFTEDGRRVDPSVQWMLMENGKLHPVTGPSALNATSQGRSREGE
jgi:ABC-type branched-subunit amino acid transport system substrate-binding protein